MFILLVEDNENIVKGLVYSLLSNNYQVIVKNNVYETILYLKNNQPDLIILDVTLPDGNGFSLYESTIKDINIPTIFLTACDDEDEIVKGLTLGAEDYLTKPFSTKELLIRINKILKRQQKNNLITVKNIQFDMDKMLVYQDKEILNLTSLELRILHLLFLNLNKIVSRNAILDKIWEATGNDVDDHTITVYLKRIRAKIGDDIITTVKGLGYRIDADGK